MNKWAYAIFVVLFVCGLCLMNTGYAFDLAKLHMKISGVKNGMYYLCVSNGAGCSNIVAGNKGKVILIDTGAVSYIFTANPYTQKVYPQPLPDSCKVEVAKDQTLTVKGNMIMHQQAGSQPSVQINNLHCELT